VRIDSLATVLIALGTTVAATALLAHAWDRRRVAGRILLTTAVVLALTATAGLQLNRLTATYPTWASLLSPATGANLEVPEGAPPPVVPDGGRLARFTVPGPAGGLTLPMAAYLPAAYFSAQGRQLRFPVIEALHGFPGTPETWFRRLNVQRVLDREIAAGRMAPTVVLFPYQTPDRLLDTECTNLTDGPQTETYLTDDVPRWARDHLRVRTDRAGWALIGYSAGAFCAMNLALRHPGKYIAGASLSGYAGPGIKVGDGSEKTTNNIVWRLTHLPPPPVALYIAWARDDKASRKASEHITRLAKPPLAVTTATVARGGHSSAAWRSMEPPAFDWLSARLARAEPITAPARAAQSAQLRG
jgi:S-formylglutathione hydrolase FrmB